MALWDLFTSVANFGISIAKLSVFLWWNYGNEIIANFGSYANFYNLILVMQFKENRLNSNLFLSSSIHIIGC